MKTKQTHKYTQDVDTIYASYQDEAFIKAKMAALGARNIEVQVNAGSGDRVTVKITREVPAEAPGMLQKFVKPWNKLTQTEVWKGSAGGPYHCDVNVETEGVPITMQSKRTLTATNDGCISEGTTEIKCSIPLIGGRLAKFVGEASAKVLQGESQYIRENA